MTTPRSQLFLSIGLLLAGIHFSVADYITATTHDGEFLGGVADGIAYFRGIPYAVPPVGPLRWAAPIPAPPHQGTLNATKYGSECVQGSFMGNAVLGSEDCLYLNVYAPANVSCPLPVMVWIHGGGFQEGAGSDELWDGVRWLPQLPQEVVLVTINYRLNVFGFLGSRALKSGGALNLGLQDQQQALRWVRRNIASFGGSPHNVTAFGESAGAVSIASHLLANRGRQRLFQKAIMESGSYPSLFTEDLHSLASAQRVYDGIATRLGCASATDVLACMRLRNVSDVFNAIPANLPYGNLNLSPVLASPFFSRLPEKSVSQGFISYVPKICGTNSVEGRFFLETTPGVNISNTPQFTAFIHSFLPLLDASEQATASRLYEPLLYFSSAPSPYFRAAAELLGDVKFICNSEYLCNRSALVNPQKTFRYRFNFTINGQPATHTDELPYVFPSTGSNLTTGNDIFLSAWPHMAYYGVPTFNATEWPSYAQGEQIVMNAEGENTVEVASEAHQARCSFWRAMEEKYLPQLLS